VKFSRSDIKQIPRDILQGISFTAVAFHCAYEGHKNTEGKYMENSENLLSSLPSTTTTTVNRYVFFGTAA